MHLIALLLLALLLHGSSGSPTNFIRTGAVSVEIVQSLFSTFSYSGTASCRIMGTSCLSSKWQSDDKISCKVSSTSTPNCNLVVAVTIDRTLNTFTQVCSMDAPFVISPSPKTNTASSGSVSITLYGGGIGNLPSLSPSEKIGKSASAGSLWIADSAVYSKSASGLGHSSALVSISVPGTRSLSNSTRLLPDTSSLSRSVTYDSNVIQRFIGAANAPQTGSYSTTLLFASISLSGRLSACSRLGFTQSLATSWRSSTHICSKVSKPVAPSSSAVASLSNDISSLSLCFSQDNFQQETSLYSNFPSTGSSFVTIIRVGGIAMYSSYRVRLGPSSSTMSKWMSDSSLLCRIGRSSKLVTSSLMLTVWGNSDVAGHNMVSSIAVLVSTDFPQSATNRQPYNSASTMSLSVTITSSKILASSISALSHSCRLASTGSMAHGWTSTSSLACKYGALQPKGSVFSAPRMTSMAAIVTSQILLSSDLSFNPTSNLRTNHPCTGSISLKLGGKGLLTTSSCIRIHSTSAASSMWWSATFLTVKSPHLLENNGAVIVSNWYQNVASLTTSISSDIPATFSSLPANSIPTFASSVTIVGTQVGSAPYRASGSLRSSKTSAGATLWLSSSSIQTKSALLGDCDMAVLAITTSFRIKATTSNLFSADSKGGIHSICLNSPASGTLSVTMILGQIAVQSSSRLAIGPTGMQASNWASQSSITGRLEALGIDSEGKNKMGIIATMGSRCLSSMTRGFSADAVGTSNLLTSTTVQNAPLTGAVLVTLYLATSLSPRSSSAVARIVDSGACSTPWIASTSVTAKVASCILSVIRTGIVASVIAGDAKTRSKAFSVDRMQLVKSALSNGMATAAISVTVVGHNMNSHWDLSFKIRVGGSNTESSIWISTTSLNSRSAASNGKFKRMSASVGVAFTSSITNSGTFDAPFGISCVVRSNIPVTAAQSVTVLGQNFGCGCNTVPSYIIMGSPSPSTFWIASSSIKTKSTSQLQLNPQCSSAVVMTLAALVGSGNPCCISFSSAAPNRGTSLNIPVTGSIQVSVFGFELGKLSPSTRMELSASAAVVWISVTAICSKSPIGVGRISSDIVATLYPPQATLTNCISYHQNPSTIAGLLTPYNSPATGSTSTTVIGIWGALDVSMATLVAKTSGQCSPWKSTTSSTLRRSSNHFETQQYLVVSHLEQKASQSKILTFDIALTFLSNIPNLNAAVTGGQSVTVVGLGIAPFRYSVGCRRGGTATSSSLWMSQTNMLSKIPSGLSPNPIHIATLNNVKTAVFMIIDTVKNTILENMIIDTVRNTTSFSNPSIVSYDLQVAVLPDPRNGPSTGSTSITLVGSNFMIHDTYSSKIKQGYTAVVASYWSSDSSVLCKAISNPSLHVGKIYCTYNSRVSTSVLPITNSAIGVEHGIPGNQPMSSSASVTVTGVALSSAFNSFHLRAARSSSEASFWYSSSAVRSKQPFLNIRSTQIIISESQVSRIDVQSKGIALSYDSPTIFGLTRTNLAETGAVSISIIVISTMPKISAAGTVTMTAAESMRWKSETAISLRLSRGRPFDVSFLSLTIMPNSGVSASELYTVDGINPQEVRRANTPYSGAVFATVYYASTGTEDSSRRLRQIHTAAAQSNFVSATSMKLKSACMLASGNFGVSSTVAVNLLGLSTITQSLSVDNAAIRFSPSRNIPTTSSSSITIILSGCSRTSNTGIHSTSSPNTIWVSLTSVVAKTATFDQLRRKSIALSSGMMGQSTLSNPFSWDTLVTGTTPSNLAASGSVYCTIFGSALFVSSIPRIGFSGSPSTSWSSTSALSSKATAEFAFRCASVAITTYCSSTAASLFSTMYPMASSTTKTNTVASGSISVTVTGASITFSRSLLARLLATSQDAGYWRSGTSLRCKMSASTNQAGHPLQIVLTMVTIDQASTTFSKSVSFSSQQLSSVAPANSPMRTGSNSVTLTGVGFGQSNDPSEMARMSGTSLPSSFWISDSVVFAKLHRLLNSFDLNIAITIGRTMPRYSVASGLSFNACTMSSAVSGNGPITGGTSATILGLSFCTSTIQARLGTTAEEATMWLSESSMRLRKPSATFDDNKIAPMVISIISSSRNGYHDLASITNAISLDQIVLSSLEKTNSPMTGSASITVLEAISLGLFSDSSAFGRVGFTASASMKWISTTSVVSKTCLGGRGKMSIICTTGVAEFGTLTQCVSVDRIYAVTTKRGNAATTAATSITLMALSLDCTTPSTRLGQSSSPSTKCVSQTSLILKPCPGMEKSRALVCTSEHVQSTLTLQISFDVGFVSKIFRTNFPVSGATSIVVLGTGYYPSETTRILQTLAESSVFFSLSSVACKSVKSVLNSVVISISVGMQQQSSQKMASADLVTLERKWGNIPVTGSISITLTGNLGPTHLSSASRMGGTVPMVQRFLSETSIQLKSSQFSKSTLTVAGMSVGINYQRASCNLACSQDVVPIHRFTAGTNSPATGSVIALAYVKNAVSTLNARVGKSSTMRTDWSSTTSIGFKRSTSQHFFPKTANGGAAAPIQITAAIQYSTVTNSLSIDEPAVASFSSTNVAFTGSTLITVVSQGLPLLEYTSKSRMGNSSPHSSKWLSSSNVLCKSVSIQRRMDVAMCVSWFSTLFSSVRHVTADGGYVVSTTGLRVNFASTAATSVTLVTTPLLRESARLGTSFTACEAALHLGDTSIRCKIPSGTQRRVSSAVCSAEMSRASASMSFSYSIAVPVPIFVILQQFDDGMFQYIIKVPTSSNLPATGAISCTVLTKFSAFDDRSPQLVIGRSKAESSRWISATAILALSSRYHGGLSRAEVVTVGGMIGSASSAITYEVSAIKAVRPGSNSPATGSVFATVIGMNMNPSASNSFSRTSAETSFWTSESAMTAKRCRGLGSFKAVCISTSATRTLSESVTVDGPAISSSIPINIPYTGNVFVTVIGSGVGSFDGSLAILQVGATRAPSTTWVSDSSVISKIVGCVGSDQGKGQNVALTVNGKYGSCPNCINYNNPPPMHATVFTDDFNYTRAGFEAALSIGFFELNAGDKDTVQVASEDSTDHLQVTFFIRDGDWKEKAQKITNDLQNNPSPGTCKLWNLLRVVRFDVQGFDEFKAERRPDPYLIKEEVAAAVQDYSAAVMAVWITFYVLDPACSTFAGLGIQTMMHSLQFASMTGPMGDQHYRDIMSTYTDWFNFRIPSSRLEGIRYMNQLKDHHFADLIVLSIGAGLSLILAFLGRIIYNRLQKKFSDNPRHHKFPMWEFSIFLSLHAGFCQVAGFMAFSQLEDVRLVGRALLAAPCVMILLSFMIVFWKTTLKYLKKSNPIISFRRLKVYKPEQPSRMAILEHRFRQLLAIGSRQELMYSGYWIVNEEESVSFIRIVVGKLLDPCRGKSGIFKYYYMMNLIKSLFLGVLSGLLHESRQNAAVNRRDLISMTLIYTIIALSMLPYALDPFVLAFKRPYRSRIRNLIETLTSVAHSITMGFAIAMNIYNLVDLELGRDLRGYPIFLFYTNIGSIFLSSVSPLCNIANVLRATIIKIKDKFSILYVKATLSATQEIGMKREEAIIISSVFKKLLDVGGNATHEDDLVISAMEDMNKKFKIYKQNIEPQGNNSSHQFFAIQRKIFSLIKILYSSNDQIVTAKSESLFEQIQKLIFGVKEEESENLHAILAPFLHPRMRKLQILRKSMIQKLSINTEFSSHQFVFLDLQPEEFLSFRFQKMDKIDLRGNPRLQYIEIPESNIIKNDDNCMWFKSRSIRLRHDPAYDEWDRIKIVYISASRGMDAPRFAETLSDPNCAIENWIVHTDHRVQIGDRFYSLDDSDLLSGFHTFYIVHSSVDATFLACIERILQTTPTGTTSKLMILHSDDYTKLATQIRDWKATAKRAHPVLKRFAERTDKMLRTGLQEHSVNDDNREAVMYFEQLGILHPRRNQDAITSVVPEQYWAANAIIIADAEDPVTSVVPEQNRAANAIILVDEQANDQQYKYATTIQCSISNRQFLFMMSRMFVEGNVFSSVVSSQDAIFDVQLRWNKRKVQVSWENFATESENSEYLPDSFLVQSGRRVYIKFATIDNEDGDQRNRAFVASKFFSLLNRNEGLRVDPHRGGGQLFKMRPLPPIVFNQQQPQQTFHLGSSNRIAPFPQIQQQQIEQGTAGRELFTNFDRILNSTSLTTNLEDTLVAVRYAITEYGRMHGVSPEECEQFHKKLQRDLKSHPQQEAESQSAVILCTRLWTSYASWLVGGQLVEFCSILQHALRTDDVTLLEPACVVIKAINQRNVERQSGTEKTIPWPMDNKLYRGGSLPRVHFDWFTSRVGSCIRFRTFFATSCTQDTAKYFIGINRDPHSKVLWIINIDRHCKNVNYLDATISTNSREEEFLFAPYSVFTIRSASYNTEEQRCEIELDAAVDSNQLDDYGNLIYTGLDLAPWS